MKHEQLAFVNQQLAGMLRSGIPLEGALRRLSGDMEAGRLREELQALEADLSRGRPLADALEGRRLPSFYVRMLQVGARSEDLAGMLALLGDYYQRSHLVWTRLSGLLVYPLIVVVCSLVLSVGLGLGMHFALGPALAGAFPGQVVPLGASPDTAWYLIRSWAPAAVAGLLGLAVVVGLAVPTLRRRLRWRLPGFKEGALANVAAALHVMLSKGCALGEAIGLARELESGSPAGVELARWGERLAAGQGKLPEMAGEGRCFPPLFVWIVAQGGEDVSAGFGRAAELYYQRALHRTEMLLYLALPASVVFLGFLLTSQFFPLLQMLLLQMDMLGAIE